MARNWGEKMDFRQLRFFVTVLEEGSLSAASRKCRLSQPALSQQMQSLEDQLGEPLLIRGSRGVEPTAAGRLLLEHAHLLLAQEEALRGQFAGRRELEAGVVVFGVIPTIAPSLLPRVLGPFRAAHPGVMVSVVEGRTSQLIERTVSGEIEFAVVSDVTGADRKRWSLHVREILREPLLLAMPPGHALARRVELPDPADLEADELIHLSEGHCLAERTLRLCRIRKPNPNLQCDQLATALALVSAGMGVTVVPKLAAQDYPSGKVVFRPFGGSGLHRVVSMMKRRGTKPSAAAARLLDYFSRKD